MKCLSCNSEIPDNSTVCPICNHLVENTNLSDTAVIPATPTTPVLPQDQDMVISPVENTISEESIVTPLPQNNIDVVNATPMPGSDVSSEVILTNVSEPTPVSSPIPPQVTPQPINVVPQVDPKPVISNSTPVSNNISNQANNIITINPDGTEASSGDGIKLASSYQEEQKIEKKKKQINKKKIIILLIVFIILGLIAGGAYYFYNKQFKTASIRTNLVVDNLTSILSFNNDNINLGSGKFNASLVYAADKTNYKIETSGDYAYDLKKQISNNKITINTLNNGEDLISKSVNIELHINDNKEYLLLDSIYENYITREDDSIEELFKGIKDNDINYSLILLGYKNALKNALSIAPKVQKITDYSGKKVNMVTLNIHYDIKNLMAKQFYTSLANNQMFIEEYSKLNNSPKEDIIKEFNDKASNSEKVEYSKDTYIFNLYTDIFKDEFIALTATIDKENSKINLSIKPKGNGYDINIKKDKQDIFNASYSKTIKRDSKVVEDTYDVSVTLFASDVAHKIDLNLINTKDINPKVEKKAIKNSIDYRHISPEILDTIKNNIKNNGKLGLNFSEYIDYLKSIPNSDGTYNIVYDSKGEYEIVEDQDILSSVDIPQEIGGEPIN